MIPTAPLAHPNHFIRGIDSMQVTLAGIADERVACFVDCDTRLTRLGIHADQTESLMTALVIEKRKRFAVQVPGEVPEMKRIGEILFTTSRFLFA